MWRLFCPHLFLISPAFGASILLALRLPHLGKRELILMLFVRLFDLCLFRFVGFFFILVSGRGLRFVIVALPGLFSFLFFFGRALHPDWELSWVSVLKISIFPPYLMLGRADMRDYDLSSQSTLTIAKASSDGQRRSSSMRRWSASLLGAHIILRRQQKCLSFTSKFIRPNIF